MSGWNKNSYLKYCTPTPKIIILGVGILLSAGLIKGTEVLVNRLLAMLGKESVCFDSIIIRLIFISLLVMTLAIIEYMTRSDKRRIKYVVRKRLCCACMGNPLHLSEGEIEPYISVKKAYKGKGFVIRVECLSAKYDDVSSLETTISDSLRKKYGDYAVVSKEEDVACRYVDYYIEDVVAEYNRQSIYYSLDDVPSSLTKIYIREDVFIDLSRVLNSSAIITGKSRSGKTTAIISTFILPVLKLGRDDYGSRVIIVDPKSAELSMCNHVLSPDVDDGSVEHILEAIRDYNLLRIKRQRIINEACKKSGKAHKWFELGMHPSLLFIDEFIAIQSMIKNKESITEFKGLLRQIATQGASAGVFLILSSAEASVGTGGLETAINNACGIRVLFKPSLSEARFLWSSEKLATMRERMYSAGDAWISADDGINNNVRFLKFPVLEFGEYEALSRMLELYYSDADDCEDSSEAKNLRTVPGPNSSNSI